MQNFRHNTKIVEPVPYDSANKILPIAHCAQKYRLRTSCIGLAPIVSTDTCAHQCKTVCIVAQQNSCSGFTLVETLVAISLLLLVIVGPMSIASQGIQNAYFAGDQTTAIFLAQEAIEHIQSLRDDNALEEAIEFQAQGNNNDDNVWQWYSAGGEWSTYCRSGTGCDIDFDTGDYRDCGTQSRCQLQKYTGSSAVDRIFAYQAVGSGWSDSPFTRVIQIGTVLNNAGSPMAVPVTVTVFWESSLFGGRREVVLQTYLYNLYSRFE